MSLINDALRRAGERDRKRRRVQRSPLSPLQPVDRLDRTSVGLKWVGGLLFISFSAAVWFLWQATQPQSSMPTPPPPSASVRPAESMAAAVVPVAEDPLPPKDPNPSARETTIKVSTNLVRRVVTASPSALAAEPSEAVASEEPSLEEQPIDLVEKAFPDVKLQSVILTSGQPMAMINGKTVLAGEQVDGVGIVEIRPRSVLLRWQDQEREVWLREL